MGFYAGMPPVSMLSLNGNIDGDLVFTDAYGTIRKSSNNTFLFLESGINLAGAPNIQLGSAPYGITTWGEIWFNLGGSHRVCGMAFDPRARFELNMQSHQISQLGQPQYDGDAVSHKNWATYTPTLAWSGAGTPGSIVNTGRWTQIGNTVYFSISGHASITGGTITGLTATTPATCANTIQYTCLSNEYLAVATTNTVGSSYVSPATNVLTFYPWTTVTANDTVYWRASGFFEV